MEEFSRAAAELYRNRVEGAISDYAVTDYGVHILYLSKIPKAGEIIGINDTLSYGATETLFEKIYDSKLSERINQRFTVWQNQNISSKQNDSSQVKKFEKAYKNLYS